MTVASGAASYTSGSALSLLLEQAAQEHNLTIGHASSILLALALGYVFHYLSQKGFLNVHSSEESPSNQSAST